MDHDKRFRLLDTGLMTAAENMALDEIILEEAAAGRSKPTFRFLRFSPPAALVGWRQDVYREIRLDFCRENNIDVNRRITGGGAIYFQSSALGWELFGRPGRGPFQGSFEAILVQSCRAGAEALRLLGLDAAFRPRNDIEVDGRKISGTGGAAVSGGFMFQGTLLIKNEIELFLKSLRVPVEKLKKREIESLQQRVAFLEDLLGTAPPLEEIKAAYVRAMEKSFGLTLVEEGLTDREKEELERRRSKFQSEDWIMGRPKKTGGAPLFWSFYQTPAGTMRVHLWVEPRGRRIRQALFTGDFFCLPSRFVLDLEAALKGVKADVPALAEAVTAFYRDNEGEFLGIGLEDIIRALAGVVERMRFESLGLDPEEVNELFLVNLTREDLASARPAWLLLPYCSKKIDCDFRYIPDCGLCGECEFDLMYDLAGRQGLVPYSIQSFEHLMEVLMEIRGRPGTYFIGSCCDAFYAKHQKEMEGTGARGLLINLDSTTCYDLGKGMEAYVGRFENKTDLNCGLITKMLEKLDV